MHWLSILMWLFFFTARLARDVPNLLRSTSTDHVYAKRAGWLIVDHLRLWNDTSTQTVLIKEPIAEL